MQNERRGPRRSTTPDTRHHDTWTVINALGHSLLLAPSLPFYPPRPAEIMLHTILATLLAFLAFLLPFVEASSKSNAKSAAKLAGGVLAGIIVGIIAFLGAYSLPSTPS